MRRGTSFEKVLAEVLADGSWFRFPRYFLAIMSSEESILLAYLVNRAYQVRAHIRNDGWFFCRSKDIERHLFVQRRTQTKQLNRLIKRGYLSKEIRGLPGKRWFRLNLEKIWDDVTRHMDELETDEIELDLPGDMDI